MNAKNTIIVPTDFSENAWKAVLYAANIAENLQYELHLLHVYQTLTRVMAGKIFNEELALHTSQRSQEQIDGLTAKIKHIFPNLKVNSKSVQGELTPIVLDLIEQENYKLLIMGTKGASGFKNIAFGSNTFDLIQKSPIGVLAIPENYENFHLRRVGLLTNFKKQEVDLLKGFIHRTSPNIDVSMIHIHESLHPVAEEEISIWKKNIRQEARVQNVNFLSIETVKRLDTNQSIPQSINWLISEGEIDILLISYNKKSFFRELFSKNLTKTIAHNLSIPAYFKSDI